MGKDIVLNVSFCFQFCYLGIATSLELNHKPVDKAVKGQEVCIKIENVPGETPKLYGRHFDEKDTLVSKVRPPIKRVLASYTPRAGQRGTSTCRTKGSQLRPALVSTVRPAIVRKVPI